MFVLSGWYSLGVIIQDSVLLSKFGNGMLTVYFLDESCLAKNIGCHGSSIFAPPSVWC